MKKKKVKVKAKKSVVADHSEEILNLVAGLEAQYRIDVKLDKGPIISMPINEGDEAYNIIDLVRLSGPPIRKVFLNGEECDQQCPLENGDFIHIFRGKK